MFKLLIVDDEYQTLMGLRDLVDWESLSINDVKTASNGKEALEILTTYDADILLTDVRMEGVDGLKLGDEIRQMKNDMPIVYMSGYAESDYIRKALRINAVDYLYKPIKINELTLVISQITENLKKKKKEKEEKQSRNAFLKDFKPFILNNFFNDWFDGLITNEDTLKNYLDLLKLSFIYESGVSVIYFQPDWVDIPEQKEIEQIKDSIETRLSTIKVRAIICTVNTGLIVLLPEQLNQSYLVVDLKSYINQKLGLEVIVGSSHYHENWLEIPQAVREAKNSVVLSEQSTSVDLPFQTGENHYDHSIFLSFEDLLASGDKGRLIASLKYNLYPDEQIQKEQLISYVLKTDIFLKKHGYASINSLNFCQNQILHSPIQIARGLCFKIISKACDRISDKKNSGYSAVTHMVIDIIENQYATNLSIQDIAETVHYSESHLSTLFKEETGLTIGSMIIHTRLKNAKKMLQENDRPVYKIARDVGYTDEQYFHRVFKKYTSMTPLEYRRKCKP